MEFEDDFCRVLIAINTAWVAADNRVLRSFMNKWVSHPVTTPNRRIVSGRVLERVAEGVEKSVALTVAGKMGTGQSDGWKNVAKTHLVSSLMSVENQVRLEHFQSSSGLQSLNSGLALSCQHPRCFPGGKNGGELT